WTVPTILEPRRATSTRRVPARTPGNTLSIQKVRASSGGNGTTKLTPAPSWTTACRMSPSMSTSDSSAAGPERAGGDASIWMSAGALVALVTGAQMLQASVQTHYPLRMNGCKASGRRADGGRANVRDEPIGKPLQIGPIRVLVVTAGVGIAAGL